jgi:hypothetical protein
MTSRAVVLAGLLALSSGCYRIEEEGTTTTLRFSQELLLGMTVLCVGIVLAFGWWVMRPQPQRQKGIAVTVVAGFVCGAILSGMWQDRIVITPTEAVQPIGFWFAPAVKRIRYAAVESISIWEVPRRGHRRRVWFVRRIGGTVEEIEFGDLWVNNEELIVQKLRGYGVKFLGR